MEPRMNLMSQPKALKAMGHLAAVHKEVVDAALSATTAELVNIRASQINGCGFCTDMHTKEATARGETDVRLHLVAAWRDATVFTEAERAALELTEEATRIADAAGGVSDEVWANASKHYDEQQLLALVTQIALINAYNRLNVATRNTGGNYTAGQFG
ncbi:carboxymuconolactone decarboxylase family protein [Streptomyces sp. P38-E01]|uniref:Carboxymuconolactone decarboxylase family protein n=1 Tax=Streptomyces tardus TaxID=2780544 RepID=A0A949N5U5_9ACTN|nr:carboxymuconolactone decarboxylase family protein [Streptomyces tardus]MBU7598372.1 carboxymuconolactone decarboxylase family protein [Streptomyces tardus]